MNEIEVDVLCNGFPAGTSVAGLGYATMALVRSGERLLLVDTGGPGVRKFLKSSLSSRGLTPSDIKTVVLTHLHWDHCCNVDLFPHAEFILTDVEWRYGTSVDPDEAPFVYGGYLPQLRTFRKRLIKSDGEEIAPGITAMILPGHTPGGLGLLLDMGVERWCIAGDSVKNLGELENGSVPGNPDPKASARSISRIRKCCSRVLPGHDCWLRMSDGHASRDGESLLTIHMRGGETYLGEDKFILKLY